jgi:sarcosine oxidase
MKTKYDVIVLGVGTMGAAACYYLSKQGVSVLGIEQFEIPHDQGSHAGQSRIIRKAYFEHPDYVPLLHQAYHNWQALEKETDVQLYYQTGLYYAGASQNELIKGTKLAAQLHHIPLIDILHHLEKKHSTFQVPHHYEQWLEPEAGFLIPERALSLFAEQAIQQGATLLTRQRVKEWKKVGDEIHVFTDKEKYVGKKLIICGGAWNGQLIPNLSSQLKVTRQVIVWLQPKRWQDFTLGNFPCWLIADENMPGSIYGFPIVPASKLGGPLGLKVAYHHPGLPSHPDQVNRLDTETEVNQLLTTVQKYLPSAIGNVLSVKTCLYTYSHDEHFIIDQLPEYNNQVIVAAGFSGHGFKFASVVGEVLSELTLEGNTKQPIDFLRMNRFKKNNS